MYPLNSNQKILLTASNILPHARPQLLKLGSSEMKSFSPPGWPLIFFLIQHHYYTTNQEWRCESYLDCRSLYVNVTTSGIGPKHDLCIIFTVTTKKYMKLQVYKVFTRRDWGTWPSLTEEMIIEDDEGWRNQKMRGRGIPSSQELIIFLLLSLFLLCPVINS